MLVSCLADAAPYHWGLTYGKALNSQFRPARSVSNRFNLGLMPLGFLVIRKGFEGDEYACVGVSLYDPVENRLSHIRPEAR
jgi:hypothetical protein